MALARIDWRSNEGMMRPGTKVRGHRETVIYSFMTLCFSSPQAHGREGLAMK